MYIRASLALTLVLIGSEKSIKKSRRPQTDVLAQPPFKASGLLFYSPCSYSWIIVFK